MAVLENVFSWSKSRDEQFRECQRKYFYDKYASWGGWNKDAPTTARQAYVLKNLKNRWAWKGETVHHVIEHVLKAMRDNRAVSLEEATQHLTETMRRDWRSSKAKKHWDDPKRNLGLFEHEYEKSVTDAVWKEVHDSSVECLANFYRSQLYRELQIDDKKQWLIIEDLEEFNFDGARVYVKLDFARRRDDVIEIYDWKTGKNDSEAAAIQIGAYALYAMGKWNVPLSQIRAYLFNLGSALPAPQEQALSERLLDETRAAMKASIQAMRLLLDDPLKNVPKAIHEFTLTENARLCGFCNFYRICERSSASAASPTAKTALL